MKANKLKKWQRNELFLKRTYMQKIIETAPDNLIQSVQQACENHNAKDSWFAVLYEIWRYTLYYINVYPDNTYEQYQEWMKKYIWHNIF